MHIFRVGKNIHRIISGLLVLAMVGNGPAIALAADGTANSSGSMYMESDEAYEADESSIRFDEGDKENENGTGADEDSENDCEETGEDENLPGSEFQSEEAEEVSGDTDYGSDDTDCDSEEVVSDDESVSDNDVSEEKMEEAIFNQLQIEIADINLLVEVYCIDSENNKTVIEGSQEEQLATYRISTDYMSDTYSLFVKLTAPSGYMPALYDDDYNLVEAGNVSGRECLYELSTSDKSYWKYYATIEERQDGKVSFSLDFSSCVDTDIDEDYFNVRIGNVLIAPSEVEGNVFTYLVDKGKKVTITPAPISNYKYVALLDNEVNTRTLSGSSYSFVADSEHSLFLNYKPVVRLCVQQIPDEIVAIIDRNYGRIDYSDITVKNYFNGTDIYEDNLILPVNGIYTIDYTKRYRVFIVAGNEKCPVYINMKGTDENADYGFKPFPDQEFNALAYYTFGFEQFAGQKLTYYISAVSNDNNKQYASSITFKSSNIVTKADIKDVTGNIIKQAVGTTKSYAINYNAGTVPSNIVIRESVRERRPNVSAVLSDDGRRVTVSVGYLSVNETSFDIIAGNQVIGSFVVKPGTEKISNGQLTAKYMNVDYLFIGEGAEAKEVVDNIYVRIGVPASLTASDVAGLDAIRFYYTIVEKGKSISKGTPELLMVNSKIPLSVCDIVNRNGIVSIPAFINGEPLTIGKDYDVYMYYGIEVPCGSDEKFDEELEKELEMETQLITSKKVLFTFGAKKQYCETNLKLKKKNVGIYANANYSEGTYPPIVLAEALFSDKTTNFNFRAQLTGPDGEDYSDRLITLDKRKVAISYTDGLNPGAYTLVVYAEQVICSPGEFIIGYTEEDGIKPVKASCTINVNKPAIVKDLMNVPAYVFKNNNEMATFTVKPVFKDEDIVNREVRYSVISDNANILRYVTINNKGKVTINRAFRPSSVSEKNVFRIKATPVAYYTNGQENENGSGETEAYFISENILITPDRSSIGSIRIMDGDAEIDYTQKYTCTQVNDMFITVFDTNNRQMSISEYKIVTDNSKINPDKESGRIIANGVVPAGVTITAISTDGSGKKVSVKLKVGYKIYENLSLDISGFDFATNERGLLFEQDEKGIYHNLQTDNQLFEVTVMDNGEEIDDTANYTITVNGASKVNCSGEKNKYYYKPTEKKTTIELLNKSTKVSTKYVIQNDMYTEKAAPVFAYKSGTVYALDRTVNERTLVDRAHAQLVYSVSSPAITYPGDYRVVYAPVYGDMYKNSGNKMRYSRFLDSLQYIYMEYDEEDKPVLKIAFKAGNEFDVLAGRYKLLVSITDSGNNVIGKSAVLIININKEPDIKNDLIGDVINLKPVMSGDYKKYYEGSLRLRNDIYSEEAFGVENVRIYDVNSGGKVSRYVAEYGPGDMPGGRPKTGYLVFDQEGMQLIYMGNGESDPASCGVESIKLFVEMDVTTVLGNRKIISKVVTVNFKK